MKRKLTLTLSAVALSILGTSAFAQGIEDLQITPRALPEGAMSLLVNENPQRFSPVLTNKAFQIDRLSERGPDVVTIYSKNAGNSGKDALSR